MVSQTSPIVNFLEREAPLSPQSQPLSDVLVIPSADWYNGLANIGKAHRQTDG